MNNLRQYLDLFDANRDAIDANSAPAINAGRDAVRRALDGATLDEPMFAPDYGVNIGRLNIPVDAARSFRCDVPALSTAMAFVLNDTFVPGPKLAEKLPAGVTLTSLRQAAAAEPELVGRILGADIPDAAARLNRLLLQDGVMLRIGRGVKAGKPLQLVNILSAPTDLMAIRRLVVVADEDSEAELLVCDHTQDNDRNYLNLQTIQIELGRGARFALYDLEESSTRTARRSVLHADLDADSSLTLNATTLSGGQTHNSFTVNLNGHGAEARLAGMVIGGGDQRTVNTSDVIHRGEHTTSDQLFKYVLDDHASGSFDGRIVVSEAARFTSAYQSNRNLLASADARMHTEPQLEIYCDEVKCSHGATTGQLDADALFYMRTRGIPETTARNMLMQAFMSDVIDTVGLESLRDRLRHLVERRFSGLSASCADCAGRQEGCTDA